MLLYTVIERNRNDNFKILMEQLGRHSSHRLFEGESIERILDEKDPLPVAIVFDCSDSGIFISPEINYYHRDKECKKCTNTEFMCAIIDKHPAPADVFAKLECLGLPGDELERIKSELLEILLRNKDAISRSALCELVEYVKRRGG